MSRFISLRPYGRFDNCEVDLGIFKSRAGSRHSNDSAKILLSGSVSSATRDECKITTWHRTKPAFVCLSGFRLGQVRESMCRESDSYSSIKYTRASLIFLHCAMTRLPRLRPRAYLRISKAREMRKPTMIIYLFFGSTKRKVEEVYRGIVAGGDHVLGEAHERNCACAPYLSLTPTHTS